MSVNTIDSKEILILLRSFLFQGIVTMPPHSDTEIKIKNINGETASILKHDNLLTFRYYYQFPDKTIGDYQWEMNNLDDLLTVLKWFSNSNLFSSLGSRIIKRELK